MLGRGRWWGASTLAFALACFGPSAEPFLVISGPADLVAFELFDGEDEPVWVLTADSPQTPEFITYGVVPAGFEQQVPADGSRPRVLEWGEPLRAETRFRELVFTHRGFAERDGRFLIASYSMRWIE